MRSRRNLPLLPLVENDKEAAKRVLERPGEAEIV